MLTSRFVLVDPSPGSFLFTSATVPNHLFTRHDTTRHETRDTTRDTKRHDTRHDTTHDTRHETRDTTHDTRHTTHDTRHDTTLWCDTEPIRYATLHFRDLRRAASLRNRAEITVPMCQQKLYPVEFSWRRKSHAVYCEHNLKLISPSSYITGRLKDNEYPSLTLQDRTH